MTEALVQHEIDRLLDAVDGELTTHSRIVDALLDLRLAAAGNELFTLAVDDALTTIPGRTAVPNEWWLGQLEKFRSTLNAEPASSC